MEILSKMHRFFCRFALLFLVFGFASLDVARTQETSRAPDNVAEFLRTFRKYNVHSTTVYMKDPVILAALQSRPEFSAWELVSVEESSAADLYIEIARPLFTFDWTYKVFARSGKVLMHEGKVTAWDDKHAAPLLAERIVRAIEVVRPLPASLRPPPAATALAPSEAKARKWDVDLRETSEKLLTGRYKIIVGPQRVLGLKDDAIALAIPVSSLAAVSHAVSGKDPGKDWFAMWDKALQGCGEGCMLIALPVGGVMGVGWLFAEVGNTTQHFIRIDWNELGVHKHAVFQCDAFHYKQLTEELRSVGSVNWIDIPEAAQEKQKQVESARILSLPITLDRAARIGEATLEPGEYHFLTVNSGGGRVELYFYAGREVTSAPQPLLARSVARLIPLSEGPNYAEARFKEDNGIISLDEIRLPDRILRLTEPSL